jgi:o-succinylbenzoate---CoA ligase
MSWSLEDAARDRPDHPAWVLGEETVTYATLAARGARVAAWLARQGAAEGARVGLVGTATRQTLTCLHAAFARSVVPVLLHPRWTGPERAAALAVAAPCVDLSHEPAEPDAPGAPAAEAALPSPEAPLAILFTSGTTGASRGVVLSRRAFEASARASAAHLGWHADDRWLLSLPVAHVGGLSILTRCFLARATVVLPPELEATGRLEDDALIASITRDRVTLLSLVPTQLARLLDRAPAWDPPAAVRAILLGGAAAPAPVLARAADRGWPILTTYGLTEACSQVATQRPGTVNRGELGSGTALPETEIRIRDGRIHLRGPTLLSAVLPDAPVLDAEGWLDTGDHGSLDAAGQLHVLGRGRDLIITGGENVHPLEVEQCVLGCPGVREACVFGVPDPVWGERVALAVVAAPELDARALTAHLDRHLARFKHPRLWARVTEIPLTRAGKPDRAGTAALATGRLVGLG